MRGPRRSSADTSPPPGPTRVIFLLAMSMAPIDVFQNMSVTKYSVLLSGDHARIARWRLKQSLGRTASRRPDLLAARPLSKQESRLLAEYQQEQDSA